jgi:hypothetical protein
VTSPTIRRNPKAAYRDLAAGEGGVLLHLETGSYHGVNPIGALIWDLIDGGRTQEDLVSELRQRVEDPPARLDDEVASFLNDLRQRDLIQ